MTTSSSVQKKVSNGAAKHWSFTLNNYTEADIIALGVSSPPPPDRAFLIFGKETSSTGTPHLQGHISLTKRLRLNQVKSHLGVQSHLEVARNIKASIEYCKKSGDFFQHGVPPIDSSRAGKRSDLESFMSTVESGVLCKRQLRKIHPAVMAKYPRFASEFIADNRVVPFPEEHDLQDWQSALVAYVSGEVDKRIIIFVVDSEGNAGKSWFSDYLEAFFQGKKKVQVMKPGKYADMAYEYCEDTEIFILDCPRSKQGDYIQYDFLENVKDGRLFSPKYESRMKRFKRPHVLVFMNEDPDMSKLSSDRYVVMDLPNIPSELVPINT